MFSQLLEMYELKRKHNVTLRKWQGENGRKRKVATKSDNDVFEDGFLLLCMEKKYSFSYCFTATLHIFWLNIGYAVRSSFSLQSVFTILTYTNKHSQLTFLRDFL